MDGCGLSGYFGMRMGVVVGINTEQLQLFSSRIEIKRNKAHGGCLGIERR